MGIIGYNQLVDHVGIHGQRSLTEALNKGSLVRQKEYPTESSSMSRESVNIETSARRSGGVLEQWSVGIGLELEELGLKLGPAFSPQIPLLLGLLSSSSKSQQRCYMCSDEVEPRGIGRRTRGKAKRVDWCLHFLDQYMDGQ
ncbi:hypothetical protein Taro_015259 [Colocasia esculenta]|uniref:Uncharacterized protein n=1 Tax=Colocasia esculenta TaxID=4460 RepID=A0A843UKD2_COLES|nr:hypothetical protein [Colocasia esculenta]